MKEGGTYTIGIIYTRGKSPMYHAVVRIEEGGLTYYRDPTLNKDAWFPKNTFEQLTDGFVPVFTTDRRGIATFGNRTGFYPDAGTLELPAPREVIRAIADGRWTPPTLEEAAARLNGPGPLAPEPPRAEPTVEPGVEGKPQYVMPGAEQRPAEATQRRAEAPLKPKTAQQPMDIGMFGDEAKQKDLFKQRAVLERGRSGRPIRTTPLPIGRGVEEATLEHGYERAIGPKEDPREPSLQAMLRDAGEERLADKLAQQNYRKLSRVIGFLGGNRINPTEIRVKLQDKMLRLRRIEEQWRRDNPGQPLPENMQAYMAEALSYGVKDKLLREIEKQYTDPLINEMVKRKVGYDELGEYAYALHAQERNASIRQINPNIADPSGMSDVEAQRIINQVHSSPRAADFMVAYDKLRKLLDATPWIEVRHGLTSTATAMEWQNKWPNYVPLRSTEAGESRVGVGQGLQVKGREHMQALGRRSEADNPIAFAIEQAQRAIIRGVNNEVGQTLGRMVQANQQPDLWTFNQPPMVRYFDETTQQVKMRPDPMFRNREDVYVYKDGGKEQYIHFTDPVFGQDLARAMKNMGTAEMNSFVRLASGMTRQLARFSTSLNPDFMIPNLFRDAGEAFLLLNENNKKGFSTKFGKHLFPSIQGALMGQLGGRGYYAQQYREMDAMGGKIGYLGMENAATVTKNVRRKIERMQGGVFNKAKDAWDGFVHSVDVANDAIENGTRLSVYISAKEMGFSPKQAAMLAREATVNFNKKGELGPYMSAGYMFINPAIQGPFRLAKAMKTNKKARRAAYALAAGSAALALYNHIAGGDSEDGRTKYEALVPPWERERNFIFMKSDGSYYKIPAPFGFSMFKSAGDHLGSWIFGYETGGRALSAMLSSILDANDPLGADRHSFLSHITPSLLKPFTYILWENKDAFGRPINPDKEPWNKYLPESGRSFRSASPYAKATAEWLNEATGGDKKTPGAIDVGPGTLDFVTGYYLGGLGRFGKNLFDTTLRGYNGQEWLPEKTPILRRFVSSTESADQARRAKFFEEREEVKAAEQRKKAGPEMSSAPAFKEAMDKRKSILQRIDALNADKKLTPAEIDKRVKAEREKELKAMFTARQMLERNRATAEKRPRHFSIGGDVEDGSPNIRIIHGLGR